MLSETQLVTGMAAPTAEAGFGQVFPRMTISGCVCIYIYTYIGEQQKDVGEGGDIVCNCVGLVVSSTSFCSVVLANSPLCCNCPKEAITVIYTKVGKTTN